MFDEVPHGGVLDLVMGHQPAGLVGVGPAFAAVAQMMRQHVERRRLAGKTAGLDMTTAPVDRIDMNVVADKSAHGDTPVARAQRAQAAITEFRQQRHQMRGDAVPRRHQHGLPAGQGGERLLADREIGDDIGRRPAAVEFDLAVTLGGEIGVRIAVLQDADRSVRFEQGCQRGVEPGRHDGERQRDAGAPLQRQQPGQRRRRAVGVVVAPPQRCRTPGSCP